MEGEIRLRLVCLMTHNKPGGAQTALLRLADELSRRGHAVEVWPLYGEPVDTGPMAWCRVVRPQSAPGPFDYLSIAARLVHLLQLTRPDAVISFMPLASAMGQLCAWAAGVPRRVASQRNPGWTYHPAMRFCDLVVGSIGIYTRNVANSEAVRQSFASYPRAYVRRMTVVYNGLVWQPSALTKEAARDKFELPAESPVVVNVGRLAQQKNQALLLSVLSRLPQVHLAIAGDGELRDKLRAQAVELKIEDRVHFLGHLDHSSIADLLIGADVFAQPSLFEGQSNALLEAMNAGLAIVASDIPPQVETLCGTEGEPAGVLVPRHDEAAWIKALAEVLLSSERRQRLASRARQRAAMFRIECMADGFEAAVRQSA